MPAPLTGAVTMTGSALALSTTPIIGVAYTIKAPVTNTSSVFIGPSTVTTANGFQLDPGELFEYQLVSQNGQGPFPLNLSDFYAVGTGPDRVTWLVSPKVG